MITTAKNTSPERIRELSHSISKNFDSALREIDNINLQTRLLSFNAQVEAARAGAVGASFSVVAGEMQNLSKATQSISRRLDQETKLAVNELENISEIMANNVRGTRLADLALVNIDLVDRNLYERTCDVRWWATDSSVVDAATEQDPASLSFASKRLGVILDAYTVYFDLVLCDLEGRVIANGRPGRFRSVGSEVGQTPWFQHALHASSGSEYGFESVTRNNLVGGQHSLVYSCGVRANGDANGKLVGVLGVIFNWESLAQTIVRNTPISAEHKSVTRCCLIDDNGLILADSSDKILAEHLKVPDGIKVAENGKTWTKAKIGSSEYFIGYAESPGYETYRTGWKSIIIQPSDV